MSIFQTYLENSGSNTQRILDYLSKNAERIDQRPEIKKLLEEIKVQVSKIRTTQTGEKFISEGMRENNKRALEKLGERITIKLIGWFGKENQGLIGGKIGLKQINKVFEMNINEEKQKEIMFNKFFNLLGAADKKADKIIQTTKKIKSVVSEMIKTGKHSDPSFSKFLYMPKTLLDMDSIRSPIRNKILNMKLPKQLEVYKKLSGKDYTYNEKDFENTPKAVLATIQKILKENK